MVEARARAVQREQEIIALRKRDTLDYYRGLSEAKAHGTKIAWSIAALGWSTILDALGLLRCSPENYSALCAAKRVADRFCSAAEARGIPVDVCSYGRCIMGMMWEGDGPYGPLPAPDILIGDAGLCDAHAKMWDVPAQFYKVPSFHLDGQHFIDGQITQRDIDYRVSELHRLVEFCEQHLGAKLDLERFKENIRNEGKVRGLFNEVQSLRKAVPCPRSTRETAADIFYMATQPHTESAIIYMTLVAEDCREREANGLGVVENERFRLYYDNIPIWLWLQFYDFLERRGAVCVSDNSSNTLANGYYAKGYQVDPEHPFESLALLQMHGLSCSGIEPNVEYCAKLIADWRCDGAILFANRSCKVITSGQSDKAHMISERFGIPILEFEGDMADPRSIDQEDVIDRAGLFLEILEARRQQK